MDYQKLYIYIYRVRNKTTSTFIRNYFLLVNPDISGHARVTFSIRCPNDAPTSKFFYSFQLIFSRIIGKMYILTNKEVKKQEERIKLWNKKFKETENLVDKVIKKGVRKKLLRVKMPGEVEAQKGVPLPIFGTKSIQWNY